MSAVSPDYSRRGRNFSPRGCDHCPNRGDRERGWTVTFIDSSVSVRTCPACNARKTRTRPILRFDPEQTAELALEFDDDGQLWLSFGTSELTSGGDWDPLLRILRAVAVEHGQVTT